MDINKKLSEMTLEEKAGLSSGSDFWHTKSVDRLDIPKMMVSDGPHGLRKQDLSGDHLGINDSIKAVCFPTGVTIASSFDKNLIYEMGATIGNECQAEDVGVILGPAVNIKRSPLCGRNFEYFSEDPYLSSVMATNHIKGVQSQGVGTSIKHFLANNQEHRRMTSDSVIDERTLREIYLPSFEMAVKEAKPWTVMCSYNRVNGLHASEHPRFMTDLLRGEWGFDGFVVSDWGAVNDRVKGVEAGMDLEMPSSHGVNDQRIVDAVKDGSLDEKLLDRNVKCILDVVNRYVTGRKDDAVFDLDKDHEISRRMAGESSVLLKNDGVLPLDKSASYAFIGEFAKVPRFQGGGSSHINSHKVACALDEAISQGLNVTYARGYDQMSADINDTWIEEAKAAAKTVDVAVLFVGLPDLYESEGYDRTNMRMPKSHERLIEAVLEVQRQVVLVLHNGSPVEMPWKDDVSGILEVYLGGQAVGQATVDVLFGQVNPSGKLAETFPLRLEDNPSYIYYLGEGDTVEYREGVFVGYRYYDKRKMDVLFPFGHGLSYTSFEYSNLNLSKESAKDTDVIEVTVDVTNTGHVFGKEAVQLYVAAPTESEVIRPVRELKGFEKVALNPGETKTVSFKLDKRSFAYYNMNIDDWYVESGVYHIEAASSSRDIRIEKAITMESTVKLPRKYDLNSLFGDIMKDPKAAAILDRYRKEMGTMFDEADEGDTEAAVDAITPEMREAMMRYMPLRNVISFGDGSIKHEDIQKVIDEMNA